MTALTTDYAHENIGFFSYLGFAVALALLVLGMWIREMDALPSIEPDSESATEVKPRASASSGLEILDVGGGGQAHLSQFRPLGSKFHQDG